MNTIDELRTIRDLIIDVQGHALDARLGIAVAKLHKLIDCQMSTSEQKQPTRIVFATRAPRRRAVHGK